MDTMENISLEHQTEDKSSNPAGNYHQRQTDGAEQTILTDPAITAETDELDPSFYEQDPPIDPEQDDDEQDDEDDFPAREDLEDDDFDLNRDEDDELSLNIDEDDLN